MMKSSPSGSKLINKSRRSTKEKKKQLFLTNQWLEENYCICDGVCIPRCILYSHYLDFCHNHTLLPACAATFGKIIRQKFPNITTRRLGTRGHSKYHYYGICVKETSEYYHSVYSGRGLTRFSGSKFLSGGGFTRKYCLTSRIGTTLPEFPTIYSLHLSATVNPSKLETLLLMYRTHCQTILDAVVSTQFLQAPNHMLHFWQEIPEHLLGLLEQHVVVNLLTYCDIVLFNSLIDILIPCTMQEVSESLLVDVQRLANSWEAWTSHSLTNMPLSLVRKKLQAAQQFSHSLRRQATFLHLAQMVRPILYDCHMVNQIMLDVNNVQLEPASDHQIQVEKDLLVQLKEVLHRQATVEGFMEWIDGSICQRVVKPCNTNKMLFRGKAQSFMEHWTKFGTELLEAMTSDKTPSLTSFNLLKLLLDEYVMVVIESQIHEQTTQDLLYDINQIPIAPTQAADRMLALTNYGSNATPLAQALSLSQSCINGTHTDTTAPSSCKYSQGWITSIPEQWGSYSNNSGMAMAWQPMVPSANTPYASSDAKIMPPYACSQYSYTESNSIGYCMIPREETGQHLPPIGQVLYP